MDEITIDIGGETCTIPSDKIKVGDLIKMGGGKSKEYELYKRDGKKGPVKETYADSEIVIVVKDGDCFTIKYTGTINPA